MENFSLVNEHEEANILGKGEKSGEAFGGGKGPSRTYSLRGKKTGGAKSPISGKKVSQ